MVVLVVLVVACGGDGSSFLLILYGGVTQLGWID
jgi:hypothetical protein